MRRVAGLSDEELRALLSQALLDVGAKEQAARRGLDELPAGGPPAMESVRHYFHSIAGIFPALGLREQGYLARLSEDMVRQLPEQPALLEFVARNFEELCAELSELAAESAATEARPPTPMQTGAAVPSETAEVGREGALVLVVDDDLASATLVRTCLVKEGFRVEICTQSERALEVMRTEHPDLVILDVFMPSVDGFELCRRIRAQTSQRYTPILFLSGTHALEERVRGLSVGGDDFLQKPFRPAELAARVRSHLQRVSALREMSIRDALTRAYNRGYFDERLRLEVRRAERTGNPLALAIFDIDHFKRVNDGHGHPAGDAVLEQVAQLLAQQFRGSDTFARYGGEEFALILPETLASRALATVTRACERVASVHMTLQLPEQAAFELQLTLSAGVAGFRAGEPPPNFIARADQALYAAKDAGRNRVVCAEVQASSERG
jgi:diguanylate cyclase (GGDEF)-like protein